MIVFLVVGARPNFMKAVALVKALRKQPGFRLSLIHTGQHYNAEMSAAFFRDLRLPNPDIDLGVGSGTHAEQTGRIMVEFEKACLVRRPDLVIVVGDVNSTIACALVAAKMGIPVVHVEAGLRSFDWTMPEEINRVLTDRLSDCLFTTCPDGGRNLRKEGIPPDRIFFVGNVMIDTLLAHAARARQSEILKDLGLRNRQGVRRYAVLTLHRPSNVDDPAVLKRIFSALIALGDKIPIVFPVHPRALKMIREAGLDTAMAAGGPGGMDKGLIATPPLGYLDFLCLMSHAVLVLTDSGGIQEETTILGIPCLTLRNNTERPVTIREGTNILVGNDPVVILKTALHVLESGPSRKKTPKFWDGRAAVRIGKILSERYLSS